MSEFSARTTADVQHRLAHSTPEEGEMVLQRAHRSMVLGALQSLPRRAFPKDLGAVGIIVEAAELFAMALYFSRGTTMTKGFIDKGLEDLCEWLQRSRSLFGRYTELAAELPPPKPKSGEPRKVAAAYALIASNMLGQILEHARDPEDEESIESEAPAADENQLVTVPGQTLKEMATALGSIMCCWFDGPRVDTLMASIEQGHQALRDCRPLMAVADPEQSRGNA